MNPCPPGYGAALLPTHPLPPQILLTNSNHKFYMISTLQTNVFMVCNRGDKTILASSKFVGIMNLLISNERWASHLKARNLNLLSIINEEDEHATARISTCYLTSVVPVNTCMKVYASLVLWHDISPLLLIRAREN